MNKTKQFISAAIIAGLSSVAMAGVATSSGNSSAGFHPATAANSTTSDQPAWQAAFYNRTDGDSTIYVSADLQWQDGISMPESEQSSNCADNPQHCMTNSDASAKMPLHLFDENHEPISYTGQAVVKNNQCVFITGSEQNGYYVSSTDNCKDTYNQQGK